MSSDLDRASTEFAQDIQDLLETTLPSRDTADTELRRLTVLQHREWRVIRPGTAARPGSVELLHEGKHIADLGFSFRCALDQTGKYLAVRKSTFQLTSVQEGAPLLRLDFDHKAHSVPTAHWNVHAERGATSVLLARCNRKHDGLLSHVHLPVGGTRYRPCLEDFLQMLFVEFNIDRLSGWDTRLEAGRERWRRCQAKTTARDSPEDAAEALRNLGYQVTPPAEGNLPANTNALQGR